MVKFFVCTFGPAAGMMCLASAMGFGIIVTGLTGGVAFVAGLYLGLRWTNLDLTLDARNGLRWRQLRVNRHGMYEPI